MESLSEVSEYFRADYARVPLFPRPSLSRFPAVVEILLLYIAKERSAGALPIGVLIHENNSTKIPKQGNPYFPHSRISIAKTGGAYRCHGSSRGRDSAPKKCPSPSLDISLEFQESVKQRSGWGVLGKVSRFGVRAKRAILRAGGALDSIAPPGDLLFLTFTLPGSSEQAMRCIAEWSGYLVNTLNVWINYHVERKLQFYVWEFQKRGALHLHWCAYAPDGVSPGEWESRARAEWYRALQAVSAKSGVDIFERRGGGTWKNSINKLQVRVVRCKKSVAAYLSKYMGKGLNSRSFAVRSNGQNGLYFPSRWWGQSRQMKGLVDSLSFTSMKESLSLKRAKRVYEELLSIIESGSLKSYEYNHAFGHGKTQIHYIRREASLIVWNQILEVMRMPCDRGNAPSLREATYRCLCMLTASRNTSLITSLREVMNLDYWVETLTGRRFGELQDMTLLGFLHTLFASLLLLNRMRGTEWNHDAQKMLDFIRPFVPAAKKNNALCEGSSDSESESQVPCSESSNDGNESRWFQPSLF